MPDLPKNTATNIDEFNEQARSFVTKAKASGSSNTAIANTIQLMYGMYTQNQAELMSPQWELKDIDGDGQAEWVNTRTQEIKYAEVPDMPGAEFDVETEPSATTPTGDQPMSVASIQEKIESGIKLNQDEYNFYKDSLKQETQQETDPNSVLARIQAIDEARVKKDPITGALIGDSTITGAPTGDVSLQGSSLQGLDLGYLGANPLSISNQPKPSPFATNPFIKNTIL